jgi:acetyl esterase/lipase
VFDIRYGPHPQQRLDLYLPDRPVAAPLVLVAHGGGWSVGDKSDYAAMGAQLAREGLVAAVANYRLSPTVQHPAHAQDVARAVAWC